MVGAHLGSIVEPAACWPCCGLAALNLKILDLVLPPARVKRVPHVDLPCIDMCMLSMFMPVYLWLRLPAFTLPCYLPIDLDL